MNLYTINVAALQRSVLLFVGMPTSTTAAVVNESPLVVMYADATITVKIDEL